MVHEGARGVARGHVTVHQDTQQLTWPPLSCVSPPLPPPQYRRCRSGLNEDVLPSTHPPPSNPPPPPRLRLRPQIAAGGRGGIQEPDPSEELLRAARRGEKELGGEGDGGAWRPQ